MNMPLAVAVSPQGSADVQGLSRLVARADSPVTGAAVDVRWLVLRDDFVSGLDALTLSAWLAPQSERVELVPEVPVTHTEPFHVSTATATLDYASEGRAGYSPSVTTNPAAASAIGRRPAADARSVWREATDVDDVVSRLWTSWEPDAVIREESTGRFIDRDKVRYVDFVGTDSVGEEFTVKGPSITPRPPRGELPTLVRVTDESSARAAAAIADIAVLDVDSSELSGRGRTLVDLVFEGSSEPTVLLAVALTNEGRTDQGGTSAEDLSTVLDAANATLHPDDTAPSAAVNPVISGLLLDAPTADAARAALAGVERAS